MRAKAVTTRSEHLPLTDAIIREHVKRLHEEVRFTQPPLDLAALLTLRSDLVVEYAGAEGPLELQKDGDRVAMILPPEEDAYEERLLLAHALGHAMLHPLPLLCEGEWPEEELSLEDPDAAADILRESQAHYFALELLMPMHLVEAQSQLRVTLFMKGEEIDDEVERLVAVFGAPPHAVRARLYQLMDRQFRLHAGVPPQKT